MYHNAWVSRTGSSSSTLASTSKSHPEDLQPNELLNKRHQTLPPSIMRTIPPPRRRDTGWWGRGMHNSGDSNNSNRTNIMNQVATRGNKAWRDNRRGSGSGRGGQPSYEAGQSSVRQPSYMRGGHTANLVTLPPRVSRLEASPESGSSSISSVRLPDQFLHKPMAFAELPPPPVDDLIPLNPKLEPSDAESLVPAAPPEPPARGSVKRERSPSPPPPPSRTLVTSGCKRYAPIPAECDKLQNPTNFREHRKAWQKKERGVLRGLGLTCTKVFFRDDGMVLEWTSPRPVWSDTLQVPIPVLPTLASAIEHALNSNMLNSPKKKKRRSSSSSAQPRTVDVIDVDALPPSDDEARSTPLSDHKQVLPPSATLPSSNALVFVPIRPPRRKKSSRPEKPKPPNEDENDGAIIVGTIADIELNELPGPEFDPQFDNAITNSDGLLEEAAIEYLRRYLQTFDLDRRALAGAYAPNAVYSYRIHNTTLPSSHQAIEPSEVESFASKEHARNEHASIHNPTLGVKQGRLDIIKTLLSLGPHEFTPSVNYDLVDLGIPHGVFLTCYTFVVHPRGGHRLAVDHTFLLRESEEEYESTQSPWPLVALSHQMAVRDASYLPERSPPSSLFMLGE